MKKKERYNRKNLRARLSAIITIYMDGLGDKKKQRLEKYLDYKLKGIVDYYVTLLKKKDRKNRVFPPKIDELTILSASAHILSKRPTIETGESGSLASDELKIERVRINQEENELTENHAIGNRGLQLREH